MDMDQYAFYNQLNDDAKTFLHRRLRPISLLKDSMLFFQGDVCHNILFLLSGEIRLYMHGETGESVTLYTLRAGEQCIINTASSLSQTSAIGSAIAMSDIEGFLLDTQSVKELAHLSDAYQSFLFSIYTLRMNALAKLVNDLQFKQLDERILNWLLLHEKQVIYTTHENIANEFATSRVVVSRILKDLERKKKLKLTRGAIELL